MYTIFWDWLGLRPIEDVLVLQDMLFQKKHNEEDAGNYLLLCEHAPCFTYCYKPIEKQLRVPEETFHALQIPALQVKRGGEAMYHGQGQLVLYWIIDLTALKLDISYFTASLSNTIIRFLANLGIYATTCANNPELAKRDGAAGVWIDGRRKIFSRGIRIEMSPARHTLTKFGCALNISTNLQYFSYILPCGLDIEMTSLAEEIGIAVKTAEILPLLLQALAEEFKSHSIVFIMKNLKPPDNNRGGIYVVIISANFLVFAQSFSRKSLSA